MAVSMLVLWNEEKAWSVQSLSTIVEPKKKYGEIFIEGEVVSARFKGSSYPGVIIRISDDRIELKEAGKRLEKILEDSTCSHPKDIIARLNSSDDKVENEQVKKKSAEKKNEQVNKKSAEKENEQVKKKSAEKKNKRKISETEIDLVEETARQRAQTILQRKRCLWSPMSTESSSDDEESLQKSNQTSLESRDITTEEASTSARYTDSAPLPGNICSISESPILISTPRRKAFHAAVEKMTPVKQSDREKVNMERMRKCPMKLDESSSSDEEPNMDKGRSTLVTDGASEVNLENRLSRQFEEYRKKMEAHQTVVQEFEKTLETNVMLQKVEENIKDIERRKKLMEDSEAETKNIFSSEKEHNIQEQVALVKTQIAGVKESVQELEKKLQKEKEKQTQTVQSTQVLQKRNAARLTRLKKLWKEAQLRNRQWTEQAMQLEKNIAEIKQKLD